jgi:hypothetical protein
VQLRLALDDPLDNVLYDTILVRLDGLVQLFELVGGVGINGTLRRGGLESVLIASAPVLSQEGSGHGTTHVALELLKLLVLLRLVLLNLLCGLTSSVLQLLHTVYIVSASLLVPGPQVAVLEYPRQSTQPRPTHTA